MEAREKWGKGEEAGGRGLIRGGGNLLKSLKIVPVDVVAGNLLINFHEEE
jgi:hypothetical protein